MLSFPEMILRLGWPVLPPERQCFKFIAILYILAHTQNFPKTLIFELIS